jgi:hypothetical protein
MILGRMRQRAFVIEHLAEVAHIDPAVALGATDEMLGFILRRAGHTLSDAICRAERRS